MEHEYKFSVIIPVYNVENYLEETILSVINQTIGFDSIQMILINDGSTDNSAKICEYYAKTYPDNIIYINQENKGVAAARNKGIEQACGELTTMLDSDDKWTLDSFKVVYDEYMNHQDISVFSTKMKFFEARTGNHTLNYKYKENKIINILEDYMYPQLSSSSVFIRTDVVKKYRYDEMIKLSEDNKFINQILFDEQKMMLLKKPTYLYRKRLTGNSAIQTTEVTNDWYSITPKYVYKYLFDLSKEKFGRVIEYIQYLVLYELSWRIKINGNYVFTDEAKSAYKKILTELIKETSDEIILNHNKLDFAKKVFLIQYKNRENVLSQINYQDDSLIFKGLVMKKKTLGFLIFDQIYLRHGEFIVYGKLDRKFVPQDKFKVLKNGEKIAINYYQLTNDYNEDTFDGNSLHDYIGINFSLPVDEDWTLAFYSNDDYLFPRYKRASIFTEYLSRSYHHVGKRTIVRKDYKLINHKRNILKSFYYETRCEFNLLKRKRYKVWFARFITKIANIFKRKELWLISDRVNRADDNGEHFFKYMVENHQDKKVYFVLTTDSLDYERMSKIGNVIDPNTNKYKLMFHRADYVVSSHAEDYIYNPLGKNGKFLSDQYKFKYIFLQHGIIKDDLSSWLNVNTKKMDMFVTSAKDEYDSLLKCNYYFGSDVVKLTGLPRFDGLMQKSKKYDVQNKIMLSFTWRREFTSGINQKTGERAYNDKFKESDYFKFINSLLNDERLLKVLDKYNYKLRFIPHPNVLVQLKDFTFNDYVEVEKGEIDYQKEFCQNKLLVTDFSSVFFDFAYLRKPVLYYQKDREEFYKGQIYDKGYFDYDKNGFGKVLMEYDALVNEIINVIKNDCVLDAVYEKRIEQFFQFNDEKNCERVYNEIKKL